VVYGIQAKRKGYWFERMSGKFFYTFFSFISDIDYPHNALTARLMSKQYVEAVINYTEKEIELRGIFVLAGFKQRAVIVTKKHKGSSTYTLRKKIRFAIDSVTSFSIRPLTYIFILGFAITLISMISLIAIIIDKLFSKGDVEGWASILASIWLVGGVIMFSLGIIGIYLAKIFLEVKNRPLTIIRNVYRKIQK
jgi:putative glycosyltransferase